MDLINLILLTQICSLNTILAYGGKRSVVLVSNSFSVSLAPGRCFVFSICIKVQLNSVFFNKDNVSLRLPTLAINELLCLLYDFRY